MDLRDRFAARFAAALVEVFADADEIARRAYDLAEAMLIERSRRLDAEEERAFTAAARRPSPNALLDEPAPMVEPDLPLDEEMDPEWIEPPYDPSWDLEVRWGQEGASSSRPGPGLARTQPEDEQPLRKDRTA